MKYVVKYFILLFVICFLCGCTIKNENTMNINYDKSIDFSTTIAFDKELLSNTIKLSNLNNNVIDEVTEEDMYNYISNNINDTFFEGSTKKEYFENGFIGFTYIYHIDNIDNVLKTSNDKVVLNDYYSNEKLIDLKLFSKNDDVYNGNFLFKSLDSFNTDEEEVISYYYFFTLNLPNKSVSNNANNVINNGKTLVWKLDNTTDNEINFSFTFFYRNIVLLIIIYFLIITLLVIILIIKRRLLDIHKITKLFGVLVIILTISLSYKRIENIFVYDFKRNNTNLLSTNNNILVIDTSKLSSSINSLNNYFKNDLNNTKIYDNVINNIMKKNKSGCSNNNEFYTSLNKNDANLLFGNYYNIDKDISINLTLSDIDGYDYKKKKEEILRKNIVSTAQKQIGNNGKKYLKWYGLNYNAHWCAIFVSWVASENGLLKDNYFPKFAWVKVGVDYYKEKKQFKYRNEYTPKEGDVIFFNWNGNSVIDHVGIVEKVKNGKVYTIEGNVNRLSVKRREYPINSNYIYGYGIPEYSK